MAVSNVDVVKQAMLEQLYKNNNETESSDTSLFSSLLSAQMLESLSGSEASDASDALSGLGGQMSSLMLLSMLGGSSDLAMISLGSALASKGTLAASPLFKAASAAYGGAQTTTGTAEAMTPVAASKPCTPAVMSSAGNRSAAQYRQVIDQFDVENNKRYEVNKKGRGDTYCNIFLWDVTSAMGAEIPHYVDAKTGAPRTYPDTDGARQMSANSIYNWLHQQGGDYGWFEVTPEQAQTLANNGNPVVTSWKNTSGHGHVQVVCPSKDGVYNEKRGVTVAQAGRILSSYTPITSIYKKSLSKVSYFAHA
jgi:hypothetical protein